MYALAFTSSVSQGLQTKLPFSWQQAVQENIGVSSRTSKLKAM